MTPAGTSNELDVQNGWEENTHTHTLICLHTTTTDDPDPYPCLVCHLTHLSWLSTNEEVNCNTFCTLRASHYSKSTPSQPYHTPDTQKGVDTVESTLVRWLSLRYPGTNVHAGKISSCAQGLFTLKGHR